MITTILNHGSAITEGRQHREPIAALFDPGDQIWSWSDCNTTTRPPGIKEWFPEVRKIDTGGPNGVHYGIRVEDADRILDEIHEAELDQAWEERYNVD